MIFNLKYRIGTQTLKHLKIGFLRLGLEIPLAAGRVMYFLGVPSELMSSVLLTSCSIDFIHSCVHHIYTQFGFYLIVHSDWTRAPSSKHQCESSPQAETSPEMTSFQPEVIISSALQNPKCSDRRIVNFHDLQ